MSHVEAEMKRLRASLAIVFFTAGCGRSVSSNAPTSPDAASSPTARAATPHGSAPILTMDVTLVDNPEHVAGLEKFSLHVHGSNFYIGAMPWMMRIGDQFSGNGYGGDTDLDWGLEREPAIGDELFMGYGNANMATGIHYEGLGKISVAP